MLPPESTIQDAFEGIAHWRKVIAVGTKYSISMNGTNVKMKASWPKGSALGGLNPFIPLIFRVEKSFVITFGLESQKIFSTEIPRYILQ
ncbi:MAG: hypothetical protein ACTSR9_18205 [Candidatus Thorarchaeota archaeon]